MRPELLIDSGEVVAVRLSGQEFPCSEMGEAIVPKSLLTGFLLSEIPGELLIRPVESISSGRIEIKNDMCFSFATRSAACATVEVVLRRKFWNADVGIAQHIEAYRQVILERDDAKESHFDDDGDYVSLRYQIMIRQDMMIEDAIKQTESIIGIIESRADQISHRRLDALTNLFDRGSFDADIAYALTSAKTDEPLSLLIVDLDKFKTINDTYGHEAGNEVLQKVARVLQLGCEENGSCYRYGGDEMTVLLPQHNLRKAITVAEQIRKKIAELNFDMSSENITASIGVTSFPEVTRVADEIFSDADAMVYQAKDDGGNSVRGAMTSETNQNMTRTIRLDIASRVEAVELWMQLKQGSGDYCSVYITNDSDEDVAVEGVTLRIGKVYLSEPSKPRDSDDWKIPKLSSRILNWRPKTPLTSKLRWIAPQTNVGEIIELDIVVWGRVLGRRKTFSHTILATYSNNSITEWG